MRTWIDASLNNEIAREPMPPAITWVTPFCFSQPGNSPGWCSGAWITVFDSIVLPAGIYVEKGKALTVSKMLRQLPVGLRNCNTQ